MSPPRWQSAQYGHISLSKLPPAEEPFSYFLVTFFDNQSMLNFRSCLFTKCFTECLWCFEANQSQIPLCSESITRPVGKTKKRPHFFLDRLPANQKIQKFLLVTAQIDNINGVLFGRAVTLASLVAS